MLRISKPFGFIVGLYLGITTRDNFLYPYTIKVQDLQQEYTTVMAKLDQEDSDLSKTIDKMTKDLDKAQGLYISLKHKEFDDAEP